MAADKLDTVFALLAQLEPTAPEALAIVALTLERMPLLSGLPDAMAQLLVMHLAHEGLRRTFQDAMVVKAAAAPFALPILPPEMIGSKAAGLHRIKLHFER